jgi:hypothetical protein
MNGDKLDELLSQASVPERSADYWQEFPRRVVSRLATEPVGADVANGAARRGSSTAMLWRIGFATACLAAAFFLGMTWKTNEESSFDPEQLARNQALFREIAALFPNRIQAIVIDPAGVQLTLSEQDDVPDSTPLLINVCKGAHCRTFITFSGQQIEVDGEVFEVLSGARGEIILVGQHAIWSSEGPARMAGNIRVRAASLEEML